MFTITQCGPTRGDCTAPYTVHLDKEYTVEEFVDAIITNNPGEWGNIKLDNILGKTICAYKWGKITIPIDEEYKGMKIIAVRADGGWSAMDYIIIQPPTDPSLEPEEDVQTSEPKYTHAWKGHVIA